MALHARLALVVALLVLPIQPAGAQGFLQSLFGLDGPPRYRSTRGYVRTPPAPSLLDGLFGPFRDDQPQAHSATYRTLCVRTCDGFYFPISNAADSTNFTRDAAKCTAACGGAARLFYYPNSGGDVETMLDLTGRAYASYAFAFKYRQILVQGCQCRPDPWSEAERERHRAYAAALAPGSGLTKAGVRPPLQAGPAALFPDEQPGPAVAPPPIDRTGLEVAPPPAPATSPVSHAPQSRPAKDDSHTTVRSSPVPGAGSAGQAGSLYGWPSQR